ncbi:hypothetical protein TRSC58_07378 [Trypanosoma rangeli SC58]|uniref:Uncharacterized protein n=1 Tax=Trypanosoma rangeli SC58 TaxID=429131 RepID=A0A061ISX6_TRYRA|nr:hypothetical protein TRSC58_07378 [Trypanosoma rangeli SC58]
MFNLFFILFLTLISYLFFFCFGFCLKRGGWGVGGWGREFARFFFLPFLPLAFIFVTAPSRCRRRKQQCRKGATGAAGARQHLFIHVATRKDIYIYMCLVYMYTSVCMSVILCDSVWGVERN